MSWDATLTDDSGHTEGDWNFTHNTSAMIYDALNVQSYELPDGQPWFHHLDGMTGPDGAAFLHVIITGLRGDPERYRAMNPANGWGNYDDLVRVLCEMRDSVPEWPTTWEAGG